MDMTVRLGGLSDEAAACWRGGRPATGVEAELDQNRFSMTWDRRPHEPFPSYLDCWPTFAEGVGGLQGASAATDGGGPTFSDCELTYTNPVTFEERGQRHGRLERLLLRWLVPEGGDGWLPTPEGIAADTSFPMTRDRDGAPGRLCVRMQSVAGETSEHLFGMTLSAHCVVGSTDLDALRTAFDVAFDWIVRGYATLGDPAADLS